MVAIATPPPANSTLQCAISPKKSAGLVQKVLLSAKANAVNNLGLEESRLRVGESGCCATRCDLPLPFICLLSCGLLLPRTAAQPRCCALFIS